MKKYTVALIYLKQEDNKMLTKLYHNICTANCKDVAIKISKILFESMEEHSGFECSNESVIEIEAKYFTFWEKLKNLFS